jgi:hypothetical protein
MRPKVAKPDEVKAFFKTASKEEKQKVVATLFDMVDDVILLPPKNQHALVIYTLLKPPPELSMGWFMAVYKTHKFSNRLSEIEARYNKLLVSRTRKQFTNRFGHNSSYTVYTPCQPKEVYLELYKELNK